MHDSSFWYQYSTVSTRGARKRPGGHSTPWPPSDPPMNPGGLEPPCDFLIVNSKKDRDTVIEQSVTLIKQSQYSEKQCSKL